MVAQQAAVDAADFWHVALAPGETKVLTLEQLDDLFRLDIIDAATRVWQPGMSEWLPLAVVAGLEPEQATKPKAAPPPPSRSPRPPSPPQRPAPAPNFNPGPAQSVSFQAAAAPARPAPQQPTAAPVARPLPTQSFAPALAPARPTATAGWPSSTFPNAQTPESFRPMVVSGRPAPAASGTSAGGRFVLALAFIAGIGLTLYRNDVLRQAAISAGQEATYMKVESALGGPGFGTPRAVQALALTTPTSLNAAAAAASPSQPATTERSTSRTAASEPVTEAPKPIAKSETPVSLSTLVAAQVGSKKAKPERSAPAARPAARPASAAPSRGLGIKGSSNGYDPLNGKL